MGPGAEPEALLGTVVAGYELVESIGMGASSWVYRGKRLDNTAAMLEVTGMQAIQYPPEAAIKLFVVIGGTSEERADVRKRFLAEAETLKKLTHANILPVIASGEDTASGFTYMILPYMAGGNLARLIAKAGPLPLERVSDILTQVAAALDEAHREIPGVRGRIVHRDVKPANILLDEAGRPYLADFSIARILSATSSLHTMSGRVMGTPAYMAPEQFGQTNKVGPLSDIYSLGMVVYEMVTGRVAFDGTDLPALMGQHLQAIPPSPQAIRPDLPEPAAAVILKALAKQPEQRFQSATAFAQAFAIGLQGRYPAGMGLTEDVFRGQPVASVPLYGDTMAGIPPANVNVAGQQKRLWPAILAGTILATLVLALLAGTVLASTGVILKGGSSGRVTATDPTATGGPVGTNTTVAATSPTQGSTTTPLTGPATQPPVVITQQPSVQVAYSAARPGPCDSGNGSWGNEWANITCNSDSMHDAVDENPSVSWYHGVAFYGNSKPFPQNYQLEVTASNITSGTCVGFWYRGPYLAAVCQTGNCYIQRFSGGGPMLQTGTVSSATTYTLRLTVIGTNQTLYINGNQALSVSDSFSLTTGEIAIAAWPPSNWTDPNLADFSDFTFTPLS